MAGRYLLSRVDRFAGLSDRSVPVQLSRIESPDLLNIDFSDRTLVRRKGFTRLTSTQFKDSSLHLDGYRGFAVIPHHTDYDTGTDREGISFHVRLNAFPANEVTVIGRGYGTGANRHFQVSYDPTINSNLGGWRLRVYDATNTTLRNVTINDGDAQFSQVGQTRHILFDWSGDTTTFDFTVTEYDGTQVGTTTATVASFVSDSLDYIIGVDTSDGTTIPGEGDTTYAPIDFGELRMEFATGTSTALSAVGRELYVNAAENEITASPALDGYWKCNDGNGATLSGSTATGNDGVVGSNGVTWTNDQTAINGTQGLEFHGERGHVQVDATDVATSLFSSSQPWGFTFLFTPKLAAGETTVRDQTLFWAGGTAAKPEPLGVRISSDALVADFQDSTTTVTTVTLSSLTGGASAAMSTYVGKKIRVVVEKISTTFYLSVYIDDGTTTGLFGQNSASVGATAFTPDDNWSVGRKTTSFVEPLTFSGKSAFCYLDDFAVFQEQGTNTASMAGGGWMASIPGTFATLANAEFSAIQSYAPGGGSTSSVQNVFSMALNDGVGNSPVVTGSLGGSAVMPETDDAFSWAEGLVEPDTAPEITFLRDFRRIDSKGTFKKAILAVSGTTLYSVDPSDGSYTAVAGNLPKGGKWSADQYGDRLFMACANGQRPVVYDGVNVNRVGIQPPVTKAVATTSTSGGSLGNGTYYVYTTFRNAETGVESNPGPGNTFSIASGSTGSITALKVPTSRDPQVNQRRVWITAVGGADGSTAYLAATIDDNTTTNYTTAITSLPATPTLTYLTNEPAPQGSLVRVFKDRLWVAGNSQYPTRAYYSTAGTLTSFYSIASYLDVDQDSGDPIVGLKELRDQIIASLRDGRCAIIPTGDSTEPFILSRLNQDVGSVSHHATVVYENRHIFLGERDVWIWSGEDAINLSSPLEEDRPSVKNFIRESISDAYKTNASMALDRSRDHLWIACTTGSNTRNDTVLVLDISQGVWSKYEMDLDFVAEIEDSNDEPTLYGGQWGFIVKLNDGKYDGGGESFSPASSNTTSWTQAASDWTVNDYKGLYVSLWSRATDTWSRVRVARNDASTLYFASSVGLANSQSTGYIGGIPWKAEFVADFGSPMSLKRIRWIKVAGFRDETDGTDPVLKATVEPNINDRTWTFSSQSTVTGAWADADNLKDFRFGGLGRLFRIMLSNAAGSTDTEYPTGGSFADRLHITEFQVEAEELSAR